MRHFVVGGGSLDFFRFGPALGTWSLSSLSFFPWLSCSLSCFSKRGASPAILYEEGKEEEHLPLIRAHNQSANPLSLG